MDADSLYYSLDLVATSGCTLNAEQRAALQSSLVTLKKNYKFHRVMFWGKILGLKEDYFIAQGRGEDQMKNRKNLYSLNCIDWLLLPPATDSMMEDVSKAAKGRFIGDPSYVYEQQEGGISVSEEKRLSVTVHQIDEDVSLVPRGAFIRSPQGVVYMNRSFCGLSYVEAGKLDNYLHFTDSRHPEKKSLHQKAELNPAMDFLETLGADIPKGSWSVQFEHARKVCVIRSLLWLGLTFYHVPMTPQHGYVYIGHGIKNLDLPFML